MIASSSRSVLAYRLVAATVCGAFAVISPAAHASPLTRGFAVVALDGAKEAAAPLARAIYSRPSLRPDASLDESRAHVLLGETPPPALVDLASTRAAIHGDDAPSRQLLSSIAADFHLRGIVVVTCDAPAVAPPSTWSTSTPQDSSKSAPACAPNGRLFLAQAGGAPAHFDADSLHPDLIIDVAAPVTWNTTVLQLDAAYGDHTTPSKPAPLGAVTAATSKESGKKSHAFYESPWFWGALGAAAFAGTAVFLATRDNSGDTIHLQMQVP